MSLKGSKGLKAERLEIHGHQVEVRGGRTTKSCGSTGPGGATSAPPLGSSCRTTPPSRPKTHCWRWLGINGSGSPLKLVARPSS